MEEFPPFAVSWRPTALRIGETLPDFPCIWIRSSPLHGTADHPSGRERRSDSLYGQ